VKEKDNLIDQLDQMKNKLSEALQCKVKTETDSKQTSKKNIQEYQDKLTNKEKEIANLLEFKQKYESEIKTLNDKLNNIDNTNNNLVKELNKDIEAYIATAQRGKEEIDKLRSSNQKLEKESHDIHDLNRQINLEMDQLKQLNNSKIEHLSSENKSLQNQVKAMKYIHDSEKELKIDKI